LKIQANFNAIPKKIKFFLGLLWFLPKNFALWDEREIFTRKTQEKKENVCPL